jgi:hypothetical protein
VNTSLVVDDDLESRRPTSLTRGYLQRCGKALWDRTPIRPGLLDHEKLGFNHGLVLDDDGVPLTVLPPSDRNRRKPLLPFVEDIPGIGGKPGKPLSHLAII